MLKIERKELRQRSKELIAERDKLLGLRRKLRVDKAYLAGKPTAKYVFGDDIQEGLDAVEQRLKELDNDITYLDEVLRENDPRKANKEIPKHDGKKTVELRVAIDRIARRVWAGKLKKGEILPFIRDYLLIHTIKGKEDYTPNKLLNAVLKRVEKVRHQSNASKKEIT